MGRFLLGYLADYQIPQAKGDGGGLGSPGYARAWAIPLVVFGGALVSALLVATFAPEAQGHGTDSAIQAVHTDLGESAAARSWSKRLPAR